MNKKSFIIFGMIFLVIILLVSFISAIDVSNCCERLKNNGPWCQNALSSECETGISPFTQTDYKKTPTSCEATSYCKLGTCVNSLQGTCMPNTPQIVCDNEGGVWKGESMEDLPECQLGCCLMGNQVAFVTLTECKKLSSEQKLETNYRKDIQSELECIASVTSDEVGACVFERDYQKTCMMVTQTECNQIKASTYNAEDIGNVNGGSVEFHRGFLCSASDLNTTCGPRGGTICKDEQVYFVDTCGNPGNIYDSDKLNDNNYWTYIQEPSCDNGMGNKNSPTCGACDYFSGSICKIYQRGQTIKPTYGNSLCASLDCASVNKLHGETWCAENSKTGLTNKSLPGSRSFRMMCYNGEVSVQPCSEFRNEICIQSEVNNFKAADCIVNKYQDCPLQVSKEDCEDSYARDCKWIEGYSIMKDADGKEIGKDENNISGSCVPKYAPGFDFWSAEGTGSEWCGMASSACYVIYEYNIVIDRDNFGDPKKWSWADKMSKCVANCYCIPGYTSGAAKKNILGQEIWKNKIEEENKVVQFTSYAAWIKTMDNICTSLGDCGNKKNYLGFFGENQTDPTSEFARKL